MELTEITFQVRRAVFEVFNNLGPGLLETIYTSALYFELRRAGLEVERDVLFKYFTKARNWALAYVWICSSKTKWLLR